MARTIIGGLLGGLAIFFIGFVFWGTPLAEIAVSRAGEAQTAAVQLSLAQNLAASGTGTYVVPEPSTAAGTVLYGRGPIATVHFNSGGFPVIDSGAIIGGLIMALVVGVLLALALRMASGHLPAFAERAKLVVLLALAFFGWAHLGQPIFNHYGWGYWIYLFLSDVAGFVAAGLIIARWFLPRAKDSPELA